MALRGFFLSLPDFTDVKTSDSWPAVLGVIATTNILATAAVYVNIWLIKESEYEINETTDDNGQKAVLIIMD